MSYNGYANWHTWNTFNWCSSMFTGRLSKEISFEEAKENIMQKIKYINEKYNEGINPKKVDFKEVINALKE